MNIPGNDDTMIVQTMNERRKKRFRAALAAAGLTQESWARQENLSTSHLSQVLSGKRESRALVERIESFTKKVLAKIAA